MGDEPKNPIAIFLVFSFVACFLCSCRRKRFDLIATIIFQILTFRDSKAQSTSVTGISITPRNDEDAEENRNLR